jgi:uncharacterized damage-inducible protein DinB
VSTVAEALRQLVEGEDFSTPREMLGSIEPGMATTVPPGCPYSIATNVMHALLWQDLWVARLRGEPGTRPEMDHDFPDVTEAEWPEVRARFVDGLDQALALAESESFDEETSGRILFQIVNHGAYHLGQVQLLKRILGGGPT